MSSFDFVQQFDTRMNCRKRGRIDDDDEYTSEDDMQTRCFATKTLPTSVTALSSYCAATGTFNRSRMPRILVIDESPSVRNQLSQLLMLNKYDVQTADNGIEGLKRLVDGYATRDFDAVLMDMTMTTVSSLELTWRYKKFEMVQSRHESPRACGPPRNVHVIFMSSIPLDGVTQRNAVDSGVDAFLQKPFTSAQLRAVLNNVVI